MLAARTSGRSRRLLAALAVGLTLVPLMGAECVGQRPSGPAYGFERGDDLCQDGYDNDSDGLIDCEDAECLTESNVCGEYIPLLPQPLELENTYFLCHDQIDNDESGAFDCC